MPNTLKNILLYLLLCGFPRLFAAAWPIFVGWLERLSQKRALPQREEKSEPRNAPPGQKRGEKKKRGAGRRLKSRRQKFPVPA